MSRNQALDAKMLFYEARNQLDIDRKVLLRTIQLLLEKKILIEGSKLTKDLVLINQHRKNIYNFINSRLGANFSLIKKNYEGTTGSSGQLIWHLQMLMRFQYIKKVKYKRFTIFLPYEIADEVGVVYFLLRNEVNRAIVKLLMEKGSLIFSIIHKRLRKSREKVRYRLNILIESNLLCVIEGSEKLISLNKEKEATLTKIIRSLNAEGGQTR